jgi:hypothetical protein
MRHLRKAGRIEASKSADHNALDTKCYPLEACADDQDLAGSKDILVRESHRD